MKEYLSADKPVSTSTKDRFQRYNFSKRIADTIVSRKSEDCIVLGIYGAWGEGKTSVINFIISELAQNEDILNLKFNPWRYKDEEDLLKQFFNSLSGVLKKGLKSSKEKVGEFLGRYARCLNIDIPVVGNLADSVEGIGQLMSEVDIDELKKRIGTLLKVNKKKVVIFIDDIDRLEKSEIHAIFRLVKLTADFPNTVYVLAFDERMVAAAIGDRFGDGDRVAGENFLQKIIQVPLKLPHAQPEAVRDYCIDHIEQILDSNTIKLSEAELLRFARDFSITLLPAITTPRLAVRFANSVAFALPLLQGEVNVVDLIFIEGIKVLYTECYDAIKHNPDLFVKSLNDGITEGLDNLRMKQLTSLIETTINRLPRQQAHGLNFLLKELFPNATLTGINVNVEFEGFGDKDKRVGDINYFNRYFSYTLQPGEISDVTFNDWIQVPQNDCNDAEIIHGMLNMVRLSSFEKFLYKLRLQVDTLSWDTGTTLAKALVKEGGYFYRSRSVLLSKLVAEPRWQLGIFVSNVLSKNYNQPNLLIVSKELLMTANPFSFSVDLYWQFSILKHQGKQVFEHSQLEELSFVLVERGRNLSQDKMLWEAFSDVGATIVHQWFDIAPEEVESYITEWVSKKPSRCIELLAIFVNKIQSSMYNDQPYQGSLTSDDYHFLTQVTPPDLIIQQLREKYSSVELDVKNPIKWQDSDGPFQTELNLARQFASWDKRMKAKSNEQTSDSTPL